MEITRFLPVWLKSTVIWKQPEQKIEDKKIANPSARRYPLHPIFYEYFDGEKTPGEIGVIKHYLNDYASLRARSWQSYYENELTQSIIKRKTRWIVGNSGLSLSSEPSETLLAKNGIDIDVREFSKIAEEKFKIWSKSPYSGYDKQTPFSATQSTAYVNANIGGDVLCVLRVSKYTKMLNVQLIDGSHIVTPSTELENDLEMGTRTVNGIVINYLGQHIAYWIKQKDGSFKKINAYSPGNFYRQAFLISCQKYRIDDTRGVPLISVILETLKKLDRYKEAAVASAEELAKIVYYITHNNESDGSPPMTQQLGSKFNLDNPELNPNLDDTGEALEQKIVATTQKSAIDLGIGKDIKAIQRTGEIVFDQFYNTVSGAIFSSMGVPPEIVRMMYDSNFSASRAALKDWENSMLDERCWFEDQFLKNVYRAFLIVEIFYDRLSVPAYFNAVMENDIEVMCAFEKCRFTGTKPPHIDPLKEVAAERLKLGELGKHFPLTTAESATESLGGGDFYTNSLRFQEEIKNFPQKSEEKVGN